MDTSPGQILDQLVMRGGGDVGGIVHYLRPLAASCSEEFNTARGGRQFRIDNAMFLNFALAEPAPAERAALEQIGYIPDDWRSAIGRPPIAGSRTAWILSFWTDAFVFLYKHQSLDLAVPFLLEEFPHADQDITATPPEQLRPLIKDEAHWRAYQTLRRDWWGIGPVFEDLLAPTLGKVFAAAAGHAMVIIIMPPERWCMPGSKQWQPRPLEAKLNQWTRAAAAAAMAAGAKDIHLVAFEDFVEPDDSLEGLFHYNRVAYARAAAHLTKLIEARFPSAATASPAPSPPAPSPPAPSPPAPSPPAATPPRRRGW